MDYSSLSKDYKDQQTNNGVMITSLDVVFKEKLGLEYSTFERTQQPSDFELQKALWFYQSNGSVHGSSSGLHFGVPLELIPSNRPPSQRVSTPSSTL